MRKYTSVWFVGIVVIVIALSGCTGSDKSTTIQLGEVTRSVFYAPQYVALAQGYFKEEGLDVELRTTAGGDKTMTALLSGAIDVALVGAETSIYVSQQGSDDPVMSFADLTQTDGTFLVSRKKVQNFKWDSLKGAEFLGQRKGGMPQMAGEFTLKKFGIDPQKDLKLIQNVDFANIPAAFISGTGDYVQLFEPQASILEQSGKGHVIASFGTESGKLPYTVYMTKKSYLTHNSDRVQNFTNAIHKAQLWVKDHSPEEIAKTVAPFFKNTDQAILVSSIQRYKEQGTYAISPVLSEESWTNLLNVMSSAGELKQRIPLTQLVDNTYANKALQSH